MKFLMPLLWVGYIGMGVVQWLATYSFFRNYWDWHWIFAFPAAMAAAYTPLLGSVCGTISAIRVWHWEWWQAVLLFFWFPVLYITIMGTIFFFDWIQRKTTTKTAASNYRKSDPQVLDVGSIPLSDDTDEEEDDDDDDDPTHYDLEVLRRRVDNLFDRIATRQEKESIDESKISVRDESFVEYNADGSTKLFGHRDIIDYTKHDMDIVGQKNKTLQMFPYLAKQLGLNKFPRLYQEVEEELVTINYDMKRYSHGEFNPPDLIICGVISDIIDKELDDWS